MSSGPLKAVIEQRLVEALPDLRWFRSKARRIREIAVVDVAPLPEALVIVDVHFEAGPDERYCLPLALAASRQEGEARFGSFVCQAGDRGEVFCDPLTNQEFGAALLDLIEGARTLATTRGGQLLGVPGSRFAELRGDAPSLPVKSVGAEQSNTSVIYGDRLILKIFRRLDEGPNPEVEIGRLLTEKTNFIYAPALAGSIEYRHPGGAAASVAVLQQLVASQGDAWSYALAKLHGYFEQIPPGADVTSLENLSLADQLVESYRTNTELLGRRTAELHAALASDALDPDFAPEPFDAESARELAATGQRELNDTLALLASRRDGLSPAGAAMASVVFAARDKLAARFSALASTPLAGKKIRCHGDYHLGQVLYTGADFVILDFEGEPARPLDERRAKQSPLKDVAGMLRSFEYAAAVAIRAALAKNPAADPATLAAWAAPWRRRNRELYLEGYRDELRGASFLPPTADEFSLLLDVQVLEKSLYELRYEVNNRPDWIEIPLAALAELAC